MGKPGRSARTGCSTGSSSATWKNSPANRPWSWPRAIPWDFLRQPQRPAVVITNGLMVGEFDNAEQWNRAAALGVANYGQMTAGGWMYIGPQGIVHGTYSTLLNAARLKFDMPEEGHLDGRLFVSSGLGGMSGAQGKAIEIAGGVGIIAEVDAPGSPPAMTRAG
jgi:urocanate hydratase